MKSKKSNSGADNRAKSVQTEDILNAILPPREWTEGGELWVQYVSTQMPTRSDAIRLAERLDQRLKLRGAREHGICTIREEIYAQCFDELIRQVTIDCPERGLLFLRLRDEARMRIAAYQSLYESSLAFAVRKAVTGEEQKSELLQKTKSLTHECDELRQALIDQTERADTIDAKEDEKWQQMKQKHHQEIKSLKDTYKAQTKHLQELLAPPPGFAK